MSPATKKIIIALTGSIGSGKSAVLREFGRFKVTTLSADCIARRLIKPGSSLEKKIIRAFGPEVVNPDRQLDRKKLAKLIFKDTSRRQLLNRLTHPQIIKELKRRIKKEKSSLIIVEIPLLFEAGPVNFADKIIVVWVPLRIQIKRLIQRDKLTRKEALLRIGSQLPFSYKKKRADFLINSSLPCRQRQKQIKDLWQKIKIM
ncbi:MAG: dephospho-CoA kinase [Elusimicrobiota bacterium]